MLLPTRAVANIYFAPILSLFRQNGVACVPFTLKKIFCNYRQGATPSLIPRIGSRGAGQRLRTAKELLLALPIDILPLQIFLKNLFFCLFTVRKKEDKKQRRDILIGMHNWLTRFHLYLFDFDGLLVNTEKLHYLAYKKMCADRGIKLSWDFPTYLSFALYNPTALRDRLYLEFPTLYRAESNWSVLYQEKKRAYQELIEKENILLMDGVEELLLALEKLNIARCVVTHSPLEQTLMIRKKNPLLNTIPHWITREDYVNPKPDPECYQKAIKLYGKENEPIIGFEDSPRGFTALAQTKALPVLVSPLFARNEVAQFTQRPFHHFLSLKEFIDTPLLPEKGL